MLTWNFIGAVTSGGIHVQVWAVQFNGLHVAQTNCDPSGWCSAINAALVQMNKLQPLEQLVRNIAAVPSVAEQLDAMHVRHLLTMIGSS